MSVLPSNKQAMNRRTYVQCECGCKLYTHKYIWKGLNTKWCKVHLPKTVFPNNPLVEKLYEEMEDLNDWAQKIGPGCNVYHMEDLDMWREDMFNSFEQLVASLDAMERLVSRNDD